MDQEQMLEDYGDLVWKISWDLYENYNLKYSPISVEDLYQEGIIRMFWCWDKFDPERNVKFSTFFYNPVRWRMKQYISKFDKAVSLPCSRLDDWSFLTNYDRLNHEESDVGLKPQRQSKTSVKTMRLASETTTEPYRFSKGETEYEGEVVEKGKDHSIFDKLNDQDLNEILIDMFKNVLEPRERFVIESYFGICGDSLSLEEIGDYLNLSRSYVARERDSALEKMRNWMEKQNTTLADFA